MTVRSCVHVDCDRPAHAKGMCLKHYQAAWRASDAYKASRAAYQAGDKAKATRHAWRATDNGKAYRAAWQATDKAKATIAAYYATAAYKATRAAWLASNKGKASRAAAWETRRARKAGASIGEPFTHSAIFDRDGWTCGPCGQPVDRDLAWPDPGSASLDHVIPLAKGGAHSEANAQLAHLVCNLSKGSRLTA